jgi:hypothetical protein
MEKEPLSMPAYPEDTMAKSKMTPTQLLLVPSRDKQKLVNSPVSYIGVLMGSQAEPHQHGSKRTLLDNSDKEGMSHDLQEQN